ncbi:MAG: SRPBCC family protein [Gammaproteobacteria bacterium]|nr:SRPBCC family protein [Gammaproteobacteria bacterium]
MKKLISVSLLALTGATASAEVLNSARNGFSTSHEVVIDADRRTVWAVATGQVGAWWNSDHTVSGDASRLSIAAKPQGCFCESLGADAGVVHLTVTMVSPQTMLRMTGGLGPLGLMGVNGNMTWEFADTENGTSVRFTYMVGGYSPDGLDTLAEPVDYVVGEALARLQAFVEMGNPGRTSID